MTKKRNTLRKLSLECKIVNKRPRVTRKKRIEKEKEPSSVGNDEYETIKLTSDELSGVSKDDDAKSEDTFVYRGGEYDNVDSDEDEDKDDNLSSEEEEEEEGQSGGGMDTIIVSGIKYRDLFNYLPV